MFSFPPRNQVVQGMPRESSNKRVYFWNHSTPRYSRAEFQNHSMSEVDRLMSSCQEEIPWRSMNSRTLEPSR